MARQPARIAILSMPNSMRVVISSVSPLKHVVELSGTDRRSPAANQAADGIAGIGKACVAAEKFAVLTTPVKTLIAIGAATAEPLPYTSRIASAGLAELLFRLAENHSLDVMRHANAQDIAEGLHKIIGNEQRGLGPGHGLVAPMSQFSLPRLCQALAAAPAEDEDYDRRQWDNLVLSLARLCTGRSSITRVPTPLSECTPSRQPQQPFSASSPSDSERSSSGPLLNCQPCSSMQLWPSGGLCMPRMP